MQLHNIQQTRTLSNDSSIYVATHPDELVCTPAASLCVTITITTANAAHVLPGLQGDIQLVLHQIHL